MTVAVTGSAANQIARRHTSVRTILTTLIGIIFIYYYVVVADSTAFE